MSLSLSLSDMQPQPPAGDRLCCNHPEIPAPWSCSHCKSQICNTCVFKFPGTVGRLCPACLFQPESGASSRRQYQAIGSLALSGLAAFLFVLKAISDLGSTGPEAIALGVAILVAALAGTALGMGTIEYNVSNTPLHWLAAIVSGAFLALLLVDLYAGIFLM